MAAKFSNKLKKIRTNLGRTQAEIAVALGVAFTRISEWEREVRTPKPLTQDAIWVRLAKTKPGQWKEIQDEVNRQLVKMNAKRKKRWAKARKKK